MGYERNKLDFKICSDNVDQAIELNVNKSKANIIIFMCLNNMSRSDLAKHLGCGRPNVTKNIITNDHMSKSFKERFCETFNFNENELELNPIVFYYICCTKLREKYISQNKDTGPLYNIDYLNEYHFVKYASAEMIADVKKDAKADKESKVNQIVAVEESAPAEVVDGSTNDSESDKEVIISTEYSDFQIAQVCSRSTKKLMKKDSFVIFPLISLVVTILATIFYFTLAYKQNDPTLSLYSLSIIPAVIIMTIVIRRFKIKKNVTQFSTFQYIREDNYTSISMIIVSLVGAVVTIAMIIVGFIKIYKEFEYGDGDYAVYIILYLPSITGAFMSILASTTTFKTTLTFKVKFDDLMRVWGFYISFAVLVVAIVLQIIIGHAVVFIIFQTIITITVLINFILGKINLSKYKLYEFVLGQKIAIEQ